MKMFFRLKLREILYSKGISQKELAEMTGLREATISEIVNDTRSIYNKNHLIKVMEALNITDLNDILEIVKSE